MRELIKGAVPSVFELPVFLRRPMYAHSPPVTSCYDLYPWGRNILFVVQICHFLFLITLYSVLFRLFETYFRFSVRLCDFSRLNNQIHKRLKMKRKKLLRNIVIIGVAGLLTVGGIGLYMFNKPHRDVQSARADYVLSSTQIVTEYLTDGEAANQKYLSADGDSKILEITGKISKITENYNGQKVVLLKSGQDKAGVSATFTSETNNNLSGLRPGQDITVKGVIRSGASYDEDLGLYENVILEKSDVVKGKNTRI